MASLLNEFMRTVNKMERKALLKDSFKSLEKIPLFIVVLKKNKELEKENKRLQKTIVSLCKNFALGNSIDSNSESDSVEILETPEKENIVYTIDDDCELFSSPVEKKIKTTIVVEDMPITLNGKQWSLTVENELNTDINDENASVDDDEQEDEVEEEHDEQEEDAADEEVEVEETVEDEVEEEEEEEEATVEEEEEEVEVEEDAVEEEEEEVEVQEDAVEEEEVYEIQIKGKTYYVTNEINSIIYEADADGDISIEAGVYKNGKPVFNKR